MSAGNSIGAVPPPLQRLSGNTGQQNWLCPRSNSQAKHTPADGLSPINIQSGLTEYLKSFEERDSDGVFGGGEGFKDDTPRCLPWP